MEMHQVRYFLALCEERNFTRAAKRCGVAQPSLTRAIKQLEKKLGGSLFERDRVNTRLTDLGILVRPEFVQIERSTAWGRISDAAKRRPLSVE
jgi:DNA-binding transcriptional LysR family regulator